MFIECHMNRLGTKDGKMAGTGDALGDLDLIWGLEGIAKAIGRSVRQTQYMLSRGVLPAKQVGNRWVIERSKLVKFFAEDAA
jgi:hypothetical protein